MSTTTAAPSFRHRLHRQHSSTLHHIQTQNIPPPAPWSSGSEEAYTAPPTTNHRPPLSPRGYSSAAATTGQSRFVEGSMNDRVSAAPPPGFLGEGFGFGDGFGDGDGEEGGRRRRGRGRGRGRGGVVVVVMGVGVGLTAGGCWGKDSSRGKGVVPGSGG
jgi:hypothetical protein